MVGKAKSDCDQNFWLSQRNLGTPSVGIMAKPLRAGLNRSVSPSQAAKALRRYLKTAWRDLIFMVKIKLSCAVWFCTRTGKNYTFSPPTLKTDKTRTGKAMRLALNIDGFWPILFCFASQMFKNRNLPTFSKTGFWSPAGRVAPMQKQTKTKRLHTMKQKFFQWCKMRNTLKPSTQFSKKKPTTKRCEWVHTFRELVVVAEDLHGIQCCHL